jgi:tRNA-splicing ligase RtcB
MIHGERNVPVDESGPCYKDLEEVLRAVEGANLAKVVTRLYPIANLKGSD